MTPDQVFFRLCNRKILQRSGAKKPVTTIKGDAAPTLMRDDGTIKVRDKDGNLRYLKQSPGGKSLAARLMEKEQEEKRKQKRGRRGRRPSRKG